MLARSSTSRAPESVAPSRAAAPPKAANSERQGRLAALPQPVAQGLSACFGADVWGLGMRRGAPVPGALAQTEGRQITLGPDIQPEKADRRSLEAVGHEVAHALAARGSRGQTAIDQPGDRGEATADHMGARFADFMARGGPAPSLSPAHGGAATVHRMTEEEPVAGESVMPQDRASRTSDPDAPADACPDDPEQAAQEEADIQASKEEAMQQRASAVDLRYNKDAERLPAASEALVRSLAAEAEVSSLRVTSTRRGAGEQARVMYQNLKTQGIANQRELYLEAGDAVIDVYEANLGQPQAAVIGQMTEKIVQVGPARVSKHCAGGGKTIDIGPSSIEADRQAAFVRAVEAAVAEGRVQKFLSPTNSDPAYHIELP